MKKLIACHVALALGACAYPTSSIEQGAAQGRLRFADAPVGAQILVDGRGYGARTGADPVFVEVDQGKHVVEETSGGQVLFHAEYDVGAGATVEVRSPR
jgi:hypothetical protein